MPTNDFLPFGTAVNANVLGQDQYLALAARSNGFVTGTAYSEELNKVWRQSAFITAGIAQVVSDKLDVDVRDDGDLSGFIGKLNLAMSGFPDVASDNVLYARRNQDWTNLDNILASYATRQFVNDLLTGFETGDLGAFLAHYVLKAGDSMTGFLTLHAAPTANNHAVTKQYVDQHVPDLSGYLSRSGGTMTGYITLHADPTSNMHATTRHYVDTAVAGAVSTPGPPGPPGDAGSAGPPGTAGQGVANYSTGEVTGNQLWINGHKIYQKTFEPTTLHGTFAHGIAHIQEVIRFEGWAHNPTTGTWMMLPHAHGSNEDNQGDDESNDSIGIMVNATNIIISSTGTAKHTAFTQIHVTLFYTCTDR